MFVFCTWYICNPDSTFYNIIVGDVVILISIVKVSIQPLLKFPACSRRRDEKNFNVAE